MVKIFLSFCAPDMKESLKMDFSNADEMLAVARYLIQTRDEPAWRIPRINVIHYDVYLQKYYIGIGYAFDLDIFNQYYPVKASVSA